ncbi:M50 family metallopeptidase [Micromonospora echinofusca]|uniref:M50 family metallopeptidase n=1 Tax=Micromonospora echinofusca TaxID=47858 RepID=UPI003408A602
MIADPSRLRRAAEHEAAHAVVADALGMDVGEVRIEPDGTGSCEYRSGGRINDAAVAIAGGLWIANYRWQQWPGQAEIGCEHDMRTLAVCDDFDRREAQHRANEILSQRGDDVLTFAEHLMGVRRADWQQYQRHVDAFRLEIARAIAEHGLDAVRAARRSGVALPGGATASAKRSGISRRYQAFGHAPGGTSTPSEGYADRMAAGGWR